MNVNQVTDVLTFSEAVPQTDVPGLQRLPAVEAQQRRLVQAEDDQSESYTFVPLSRLQATDLLQRDARSLLVALDFVGFVLKAQQHQAI